MKHLIIITMIFSVLCMIACGSKDAKPSAQSTAEKVTGDADQAAETGVPALKKYDIKSGIVHFECSDPTGTHKEVLYFDNHGTKERLEVYDQAGVIKKTTFSDGTRSYNIFPDQKDAYILNAYAPNGTEMRFNKEEWDAELRAKYKYQDVPDMTIAGKNCTAFLSETGFGKTTFAGWAHITLYHHQVTNFGTVIRKAITLEENIVIPEEKFTLPEGMEVKESTFTLPSGS
jgi:major membrane immunogen (membrane-anchored lipoprotein)